MLAFSEENFLSPQYVYHFVRQPITRLGFLYGIRKVKKKCTIPSVADVHTFISDLFVKAQLSAECSIGEYKAFSINFSLGVSNFLLNIICIITLTKQFALSTWRG